MIILKSCNNLGERRYIVKECTLCGMIYAVRKETLNELIREPWMHDAHKDICECTLCGQRLKEKHLPTEASYVKWLKPQLEILGNTRTPEWLMSEMYMSIDNTITFE